MKKDDVQGLLQRLSAAMHSIFVPSEQDTNGVDSSKTCYTQVAAFAFVLALPFDEAVQVSIFEEELCITGIADASGNCCLLHEMRCRHVSCSFDGWSLEKIYSILQLKRLGVVQDGPD